MLYDRHPTTEATVSLGEFKTHIATPEDDQMWRQVVEFQSLNICEQSGSLEARNLRNCRVRSDVKENLLTRQHARPAIIEAYLERFRCHKTPIPQDQFGSACLVVLQMCGNLAVDHVALAPANRRHIGRHGTGHCAVLRGTARQMRNLRAPNLIFAGQAIDIGTRAPDIPALHDSSLLPRARHMPGQELATRSTAKNQDFVVF